VDREPAVLLRLSTLVSETQKVESLGPALAMPLSPFDGVSTHAQIIEHNSFNGEP